MNNKAHLRPQDFDSNGDIIPMACKEEKGDLISREALKKALSDKDLITYTHEFGNTIPFEWIMIVIDNAPTVENITVFCENADEKTIDELKNELKRVNNELRPQRPKGEWKPFVYDYDIGGDHTRPPKEGEEPHWEEYWAQEFKCSMCGCKNHMSNYCPVCGADMRKEG